MAGETTEFFMNRPVLLALILLFGLAMGFTGYSFHKETVGPRVVLPGKDVEIIKEVPVEIIVREPYPVTQEVLVYVDRVKEVEVEKEIVRWRNIYPRAFESLEHFKEWYKAQEFHPMLPSPAYTVDCDDYAERVQWTALQQGYSVSLHLGPLAYWYPTETYKSHMFNMVIIGNDMYFLEPEPGRFRIWKVGEKD